MNDNNKTNGWLKICEVFDSISGEGLNTGKFATFIRFSGCNFNCDYCDTKYHNEVNYCINAEHLEDEVLGGIDLEKQRKDFVNKVGGNRQYFIFTGGEPTIQNPTQLKSLIDYLDKNTSNFCVEMETNGTNLADVVPYYSDFRGRVIFSADFKIERMNEYEYTLGAYLGYKMLGKRDCIKVVVKNLYEIDIAKKLADNFGNTNVIVSPCYKEITPTEIAEYIVKNKYYNLRMQIQLHKELWDPNERAK